MNWIKAILFWWWSVIPHKHQWEYCCDKKREKMDTEKVRVCKKCLKMEHEYYSIFSGYQWRECINETPFERNVFCRYKCHKGNFEEN